MKACDSEETVVSGCWRRVKIPSGLAPGDRCVAPDGREVWVDVVVSRLVIGNDDVEDAEAPVELGVVPVTELFLGGGGFDAGGVVGSIFNEGGFREVFRPVISR